jgi:hypothetical protein
VRAENHAQARGIDGISRWIGMRWDSADTVRVELRPELINAAGLLSGAVSYALCTAIGSFTIFPRKDA